MIIIDPGHGGWDPGGGSNNYFKEKDLALKISNYEHNRLNEIGIPNVLVRSSDETLAPNDRLNRISKLGASESDILISNHINTGGSSGGEIIYSLRGDNELPMIISENLKEARLSIRNVYQRVGKTGKDYYFILRGTTPNKAMIIEYGFADNKKDTDMLVYNWQNLAEAVVKSLASYYKVPYTPPTYHIHVVRPNESLYSISKEYNTSIDKIKKDNNLTNNTIYPRMELIINEKN